MYVSQCTKLFLHVLHGTLRKTNMELMKRKYTGFPCSRYRQIGRSSPSKNGGTILKSNLIGKPPTVFASLASLDNFTQIMIVSQSDQPELEWNRTLLRSSQNSTTLIRLARPVCYGFWWFSLTQSNLHMSNLNGSWMSQVIDTSCKTTRSFRCFVAWSSISTTWRVNDFNRHTEWIYRWWWNDGTLLQNSYIIHKKYHSSKSNQTAEKPSNKLLICFECFECFSTISKDSDRRTDVLALEHW